MGFRRLAEKGGENVEMIRLASITTGLDLAESSSSRGRLKTDRFAAIPTLSRYCERVFLSTVRPKKEDAGNARVSTLPHGPMIERVGNVTGCGVSLRVSDVSLGK